MMLAAYLRDTEDSSPLTVVPLLGAQANSLQRLMRSDSIIVIKVLSQYLPWMCFTKHNHMIQTLSPNTADQSFGIWVLPG